MAPVDPISRGFNYERTGGNRSRQAPQEFTPERGNTYYTCLYAADRIQHLEEVIKPALAQGKIVLCDRFTASSIAYQSYGRGLDYSLVEQFNQIATNGLTPDLTIWLNLDVRIGLQRVKLRGESDRFEKAALEFHQRVHQGYQALAIRQPQTFITIEANQPQALVTQAIQQALIKHFKEFDQIQMQSNN